MSKIQGLGLLQLATSSGAPRTVTARTDNNTGSQKITGEVQFEPSNNLDLIESQQANLGLRTEEAPRVNEKTANKSTQEVLSAMTNNLDLIESQQQDLPLIIGEEVNDKSICEHLNKIFNDPSDLGARVDAGVSDLFAGASYLYQRWDTLWTKLKDMGFDLD